MKPPKTKYGPTAQKLKAQAGMPSYLDAINHAASLFRAERLDEAERACRDILKAQADDFNALHLLGLVKTQQGDQNEGLRYVDQALRADPSSYQALNNRGNALQALHRHSEALDSYSRALALKPDCAEAHYNRGVALGSLKRYSEAIESYEMALSIKPHDIQVHNNRGSVLQALERYSEAIESYDKALSLKPDYAEALSNRGIALQALQRHSEALDSYSRALALKPDCAATCYNRGNALQVLRRCTEALDSYDKALSLKPDYAEAHSNRGVTLQALQRNSEAMRSYDQALSFKPDHPNSLWNKSCLSLLIGEFETGWPLYEWRWRRSDSPIPPAFAKPLWLGQEDIRGKRLLLHAEQGLGDTIQFSRYAKMVASRGATVVLQVPQPLKMLLRNIAGASEVLSPGDPSPPYDLHCPLMSLPLAFKTSLETIPCETPYLEADQKWIAKWSTNLGSPHLLRVGLVWSGGTLLKDDQDRSISLSLLSPLFDLPVEWICLQKEIRDADRAGLARLPAIRHFEGRIEDLSDTAALIELCDLVICVDTAVAHLAGAMGKALWLLLPFAPDWRWLIDRADSPWYPTARLFRQPVLGDWSSPINRVKRELESRLDQNWPPAPKPT